MKKYLFGENRVLCWGEGGKQAPAPTPSGGAGATAIDATKNVDPKTVHRAAAEERKEQQVDPLITGPHVPQTAPTSAPTATTTAPTATITAPAATTAPSVASSGTPAEQTGTPDASKKPPEGHKLVSLKDKVVPMPTGTASFKYYANLLQDEMGKNPEVAKSPMARAALSALNLLDRLFGFSFGASDFSSYIGFSYPKEAFGQEDLKAILGNKVVLIDRYQKLKEELKDEKTGEDRRKEIEDEIQVIKKALDKLGIKDPDNPGTDFEQERERATAKDSTPLEKSDIDQFNGIESADSYVSTFYVLKQLGLLPKGTIGGKDRKEIQENLAKAYDPKILYARMQNTQYDDHENKARYKLFTQITDSQKFYNGATNKTLPSGTVFFFGKKNKDDSTTLLCGIVGLDGKLKFQTATGVHEVKDTGTEKTAGLIASAKKLLEPGNSPDKTAGTEPEDGDIDLINFASSIPFVSSTVFKGAFIPKPEKIENIDAPDESGKKELA